MGLILEITNGPLTGKQIQVGAKESLTIGRAAGRAQYVIAQDDFLSGLHFTVGFSSKGCCLRDLQSANGTYLNGERIQEAILVNGDEIRAGRTSFRVRMVSDTVLKPASNPGIAEVGRPPQPIPHEESPGVEKPLGPRIPDCKPEGQKPAEAQAGQRDAAPRGKPPVAPQPPIAHAPSPPAPRRAPAVSAHPEGLRCGVWSFHFVPLGWEVNPEFGFLLSGESPFPTSISASEERLGSGIRLPQFVEGQIKTLRNYLKNSTIEVANAQKVDGATETISFEVHYSTRDGATMYLQKVYAKSGNTVGVLSLTTLDQDRPRVLPVFQNVVGSARLTALNPAL